MAMRHRQYGFSTYGLTALEREMSTPPTLHAVILIYLPVPVPTPTLSFGTRMSGWFGVILHSLICRVLLLLLFYYKIVHVVQNNEKIHKTIKNKGNMQ